MKYCKLKVLCLAFLVTTSFCFFTPVTPAHADNRWVGVLLNGALQWSAVQSQISALDSQQGQPAILRAFASKTGYIDSSQFNKPLFAMMDKLHQAAAQVGPVPYPFVVYFNPQKDFNAACGLAHVITVNAGVFKVTQNDEELAFLLAHEMAHGLAKHNSKSINRKMAVNIAKQLALTYSNQSVQTFQLAGMASNYLMNQVFSVADEWEADNLAFEYATRAGYNPMAGAMLWYRVREKYGDQPRSFIGTLLSPDDHPTNSQRIENYLRKLTDYSKGKVEYRDGNIYVNSMELFDIKDSSDINSLSNRLIITGNIASAFRAGGGLALSPATAENGALRFNGVTIATFKQDIDEESVKNTVTVYNQWLMGKNN